MGRNTQMLRQNLPVSRRLIQHTNIVGIRKNCFHFFGCQQIDYILRYAGRAALHFPEALPDFHGIGCRLFLFQQQMEFVNIVPGGFSGFPVPCDTVPHLILNDQHSDFL